MLSEPAPAKINLALHVTGKRADGYHLLHSLVVFAKIGDVVHATSSPAGLTLKLEGPFAAALDPGSNNLVLRAAQALRLGAGIRAGATLRLEKNLPIGSGLGGGSADAAASLRLLSRLWNIALPEEEMHNIALELGADVPMCLASKSCLAGGIGEILESAPPLPPFALILVHPGIPTFTADIYRNFARPFSPLLPRLRPLRTIEEFAAWLAPTRNDLQFPAMALAPEIAQAQDALSSQPGCLLARMSGSGSTCFGIFDSVNRARRAHEAIRLGHPGWWCVVTEAG